MMSNEERLYSIENLSEESFERAYTDYLETSIYPWGEENKYTLYRFANLVGVYIKNFSYSLDGPSYIDYDILLDEEIQNLEGKKLVDYLISHYNNVLFTVVDSESYAYDSMKRKGKVYVSSLDCPLTGYYLDMVIIEPIIDFINNYEGKEITYVKLIDKCLREWLKACEQDFRNFYSEENFIEQAKEFGWLFTEDGRLVIIE